MIIKANSYSRVSHWYLAIGISSQSRSVLWLSRRFRSVNWISSCGQNNFIHNFREESSHWSANI
jgi:hypothetical protein